MKLLLLNFVWNPSEGISIGSFTLHYYSLMFVVAFGLGWYIMKQIFVRENETIENLDSLFVYMIASILLGARLGHVFFYDWDYYQNNLAEILLPFRFKPEFEFTGFRGLASHGAAIAVIVAMYFYKTRILKRSYLWILDRVVIPVASGAVFVRLGNFFNSEIVGHETTSAFGIKFVRDGISENQVTKLTGIANKNEAYQTFVSNPQFADKLALIPAKHPSQLYEAFGYVLVFAILYFLYWKSSTHKKEGFLFGLFLILLFTVRIFVEIVKESQGGFEGETPILSTGQWLSIPFILAGLFFVFRAKEVKS